MILDTEPAVAAAGARFVNVGERTNVTGSAKFKKLIMAGDYDAAVEVARQQVDNGAQVIDVNMDEALLDSEQAMTITDMSGRNLSGHSVEAFWHAVRHAHPLTIGLNCAFGADLLRPHVQALAGIADALVMIYPNAGLPNDLGQYDEQPATTGGFIREWAEQGLVNVVGGCCGSTPAHIAAMADAVAGKPAREPHVHDHRTRLAGLDPMIMAA
jgi:methionine synthase I (cobalamin-dependent)